MSRCKHYRCCSSDDECVCRISTLGEARRISECLSCGECPIRRFCEENITVDKYFDDIWKYCEDIWVEWLESEHKEEEE